MFNSLFKRFQQDFSATPEEADIHYGVEKPPTTQPTPGSRHPEAAFIPPIPAAPDRPTVGGPENQEVPPPVALIVCHGMGEQVRFETIGQIAASILTQAASLGCVTSPNGVELSQQNDAFLARAELHWTDPKGTPHSVHIYEAYWAPVTEGKVTYWDTIKFLASAAYKGIRSSRFMGACTFKRYLFGGLRNLTVSSNTQIGLIVVAVLLALQVGGIALVGAILAAQIKDIAAARGHLEQILLILLPGIHRLHPDPYFTAHHVFLALKVLGWYLAVGEIFLVRFFLIEYVGDVAAYISPYKSSKFDDIRTRIQTIGLNVAKVVYGFGNVTPVPEYRRVVIAGHSLGSVLAYDTLNAIINLDNTSTTPGSRDVVTRTTHLITFGSPLDKTAFMFRNQANNPKDPLREQMVSAFQPLIRDYAGFRKPHFWINLYSKWDIISGSIDYYDDPAVPPASPLHVQNIPDPAADIPLYAHVQYWTGPLLARTLYNAVQ